MAMVGNYFAQVGVAIDPRSLRSAKAYFRNVERILNNFKRNATKSQTVKLKFSIDRTQLNKQLQTTMNRLSNNVVVPIKAFSVDRKALQRALNKSLPANPAAQGSVRIGLRISQSSLSHMRDQIRRSLSGMSIRPTITPTVRGGAGRVPGRSGGGYTGSEGNRFLDPRNTKRMSPWHNPMMVGGGLGAFMRYGFYSLPFVGGVLGLNAMNSFASNITAQRTAMNMVSEMSSVGLTGDDNRRYLRGLSELTGRRATTLAPIYTQMLAASQGTELEPQMQDMFTGLIQYSSTMGLGEESIKRAMVGFQQMIGKRTIMSEELKGQVGEHIPTVVPLMAQAMGVDVKTLFKMMEQGQLDPMVALPKLAALMKQLSDPAMADFQKSLPYWQGMAQVRQEQWMTQFTAQGGGAGLTTFWRTWSQIIEDTEKSATNLAAIFERGAKLFSGALLIPQELLRWMDGETDGRNFWQAMFGDFSSNFGLKDFVDSLGGNFDTLKAALEDLKGAIITLIGGINALVGFFGGPAALAKAAGQSVSRGFGLVGSALHAGAKLITGDTEGAGKVVQDSEDRAALNHAMSYAEKSAKGRMQDLYGENRSNWPTGQYEALRDSEYERFSHPANRADLRRQVLIDASTPLNNLMLQRIQEITPGFRTHQDISGAINPAARSRADEALVRRMPNYVPQSVSMMDQISRDISRNIPQYDPTSFMFSNGNFAGNPSREGVQTVVVRHDIQVNAIVDARTDGEAIAQAIQESLGQVNPLIGTVPQ